MNVLPRSAIPAIEQLRLRHDSRHVGIWVLLRRVGDHESASRLARIAGDRLESAGEVEVSDGKVGSISYRCQLDSNISRYQQCQYPIGKSITSLFIQGCNV